MATKPREDAACPRRAPDLFRSAVAALGEAAERRRAGDTAGSADALRRSARWLADSFTAARAATDPDGAPLVDRETDRPLTALLTCETPAHWTREQKKMLQQLERDYRAAMPRFRAALAREIPGYGGALQRLGVAARRGKGIALLAALTALAVTSVVAWWIMAPAYIFELRGQVFWKTTAGERFTEERSRAFAVHVDGAVHEYQVEFPEPVRISTLRLDPVDSTAATTVEIRQVRLMAASGDTHGELDDPAAWSCTNCQRLPGSRPGFRLKPTNGDPYVVAPSIVPVETAGIRITLRAAADKTYWEWLTRLEKQP